MPPTPPTPPTQAQIIEPLWADLRGYAQRLVGDLSDDEMVAQPVPGAIMNHPAWVLSHLNVYAPVLARILRGEPVEDPIDSPFGPKSSVQADRGAYAPKAELIHAFSAGYDDALTALKDAPDARMGEPSPVKRWSERFPTVGHMPAQFMLKHTATHLGQLSAWRRAGGRPPV